MEYAVLVAAVCAAVLSMQLYMKRGVSGRLKQGSDEIGQSFDYNKTVSSINTTVKMDSTINATMLDAGLGNDARGYPIYAIEYDINQTQNVTRTGSETVGK